MGTTAAQLQLTKNATDALGITFGGPFSDAIGRITKELTPFLEFVATMLETFPGLTFALAGLATAFVGLTVALPILGGIKFGLGALGLTFGAAISIGAVWALKIGLAIAAVALAVKGLMNLWKRLKETWKWVTDSIAKITKENLLAVWKGIEIGFDVLTLGMYSKIKKFINWGMEQIGKINRALGRSRKKQSSSSSSQSGTVQAYADGGYVSRPTRALIGEAGSEYVLPSNKISGFISNYQAGLRGQAAIPSTGGGGMSSPNVNIKTGPVMQMSNGQQYVTVQDLEAALNSYSASVFSNSRTAGTRRFMGVS
jgi:hypothetical protein